MWPRLLQCLVLFSSIIQLEKFQVSVEFWNTDLDWHLRSHRVKYCLLCLTTQLGDYAQFGLLYNFRYSKSFNSCYSLYCDFSLPCQETSDRWSFWFITDLTSLCAQCFLRSFVVCESFASLLSSRPYPHYFLQMVPAFHCLWWHCFLKIILSKNSLEYPRCFLYRPLSPSCQICTLFELLF